jgi:NTE family protein
MIGSNMAFGVAFGGGGARGFAHIGVMRVLEREGLTPGVIAGTSMGALVGALFAAGLNADQVEAVVSQASLLKLLDLNPLADMLKFTELKKLLEPHLPERFEDLPIPFAATATDLIHGKQVYLQRGDLHQALRSSIAYPGAIAPVWVGDQLLSDGGILNQIPVDAARFLGAVKVLAVDVTPLEPLEKQFQERSLEWWRRLLGREKEMGWMEVLYRAVEVMQAQITDVRLSIFTPDMILHPKLEGINLFAFNRVKEAIQAGEVAAEANLERLRLVFGTAEA